MESTTNTDTNLDLALRGQAMAEATAAAKDGLLSTEVGQSTDKTPAQKGEKWGKAVEAMKALAAEKQGLGEDKKPDTSESDKSQDDSIGKKEAKSEEGTEEEGETGKRYNNLKSYADKTYAKAERLARDLVTRDPDYIHELVKEDKKLADKIIASELGESHGITNYEQLTKALERKGMPEGEQKLLTEVEQLKARLDAKEDAEQEKEVQAFLKSHADIDKEQTDMMAKMVDEKGLTLEEAYEFSKFKLGRTETEGQIREKVIKELDAQKTAAGLTTSGSMPTATQSKQLTDKELNFLEGIGAKRTLAKYGVK